MATNSFGAVGQHADDHQQTSACVVAAPLLLEPGQCRRRQAGGVFPEQSGQGFLEITRGNALEVQPRQQLFDRARAP